MDNAQSSIEQVDSRDVVHPRERDNDTEDAEALSTSQVNRPIATLPYLFNTIIPVRQRILQYLESTDTRSLISSLGLAQCPRGE